jgi:SPP1 gp7 family putative phage head morphogenesis protein
MTKKNKKEKTFNSPPSIKSHERKFSEALVAMVDIIGRIYKNQVILELNQKTISKFSDEEQSGNYANVFLKISRRIIKKLLSRFDDERIDKLASMTLEKASLDNSRLFYNAVSRSIGIDPSEIMKKEISRPFTNALIQETSQWAKKLRDDCLAEFTARTLRAMSQGNSIDDIMKEFSGMVETRKNHAKFVARTQIANFNAIMSKNRAQNLGVTEADWLGHDDGRERPCHKARNGKRFKLSEGLFSKCDGKWLLPGTDYQCRCKARYVLPVE